MPKEKVHFEDTEILTVVEAAKFLKVSKDVIYGMIDRKEIPFRRVGRQARFPFWLLKKWVEGQEIAS